MWSGSHLDIPDGWALCDGTNGTPDLTNRFIRSYAPWWPAHNQGGGWTHDHQINVASDAHDHSGNAGSSQDNLAAGNEVTGTYPAGDIQTTTSGHGHSLIINSDEHDHLGSSIAGSHVPLYYSLCFIMKL